MHHTAQQVVLTSQVSRRTWSSVFRVVYWYTYLLYPLPSILQTFSRSFPIIRLLFCNQLSSTGRQTYDVMHACHPFPCCPGYMRSIRSPPPIVHGLTMGGHVHGHRRAQADRFGFPHASVYPYRPRILQSSWQATWPAGATPEKIQSTNFTFKLPRILSAVAILAGGLDT